MKIKHQQRFWSKVRVGEINQCWLWCASLFQNGYGQFGVEKKNYKAHRVAFQLLRGSIPDGLVVRHSCDNKRCVNPAHLETGTTLDNIHDCMSRNPNSLNLRKGTRHPLAKLTDEQVKEARLAYTGKRGEIQMLATRYGITDVAMGEILKRRTWKHVN